MRFSDAGRLLQSVEIRLETIRGNQRLSSPVAACEGDAKATCKVDMQSRLAKVPAAVHLLYDVPQPPASKPEILRQPIWDLNTDRIGDPNKGVRNA